MISSQFFSAQQMTRSHSKDVALNNSVSNSQVLPNISSPTTSQSSSQQADAFQSTNQLANGFVKPASPGVSVTISDQAKNAQKFSDASNSDANAGSSAQEANSLTNNQQELSVDDLKQIDQLKIRDAEVRQHEQAHAAAGGSATGSPNYTYTLGPDGKRYAVEGEVDVKFSSHSAKPQQVKAEAEQIRRAAQAPVEPSAQDRQVAQQASQRISEAEESIREEPVETSLSANQAAIYSEVESRTGVNPASKQTNSLSLVA